MTAPLVLALFGQPVSHSRSAQIHTAFARQTGMEVDYRVVETAPGELPDALSALRRDGGVGANLTVPLKQDGYRLCDSLDEPARMAGAVNTLLWQGTGWKGFNTDGAGLAGDLERLGLDPGGRMVLILGAGGAAAGILGPLLDKSPAGVLIANRSADKARSLARASGSGLVEGGPLDTPDDREPFDLIIQATSLGHQGAGARLKPGWLHSRTVVYDLNYGPAHQSFATECARHNLSCHDGLGMLVGQAAASFKIWTGTRPRVEPVIRLLRDQ